jgi:large subunit ribosomal protein L24
MLRIRKDDFAYVITGKDRGKKGKVLSVDPKGNSALVEGINFSKKHMRQRSQEQQGGIVQMESPVNISNLAIFCKHCNRPTRIGINILKEGTRIRFCKKCKEVI